MAELYGQVTMFDDGSNYKAFTDKFIPAKTTDDCYTPENIYEAVADWVAGEYGLERASFVRPFWPGGDYEHFDYPPGCVVVDNPPFSIITPIQRFYLTKGVRFFLFAPGLTAMSSRGVTSCCVCTGINITYDNGADINTSFVTNLDTVHRARTAPALYAAIDAANKANIREKTKELPKYTYPDEVCTAAMLNRYSKYGIDYAVKASDCVQIAALDMQRRHGKAVYGCGLLLSERAAAERAAAERAAAERAAAHVWELSEREKRIVRELGEK